jgi:hypothetical protein
MAKFIKYISRRSDQDDDLDLDWVDADIGSMTEDQLYQLAVEDCEDCDKVEVEIIGLDAADNETVLGSFII